ncbi:MAG: hypothetical protein R2748_08845 [Bryobacterales bacterium]
MRFRLRSLLVSISLSLLALHAEEPEYRMPPEALAALVDAPRTPAVSLSPDKTTLLILEHHGLPSIEELSRPELRLAGLRIDPRNNGQSRKTLFKKPALLNIATGDQRGVAGLAADARLADARWSADGKHFAFTVSHPDRLELWIADVASASAAPVAGLSLSGVADASPCAWESDRSSLVCRAVPAGRGAEPARPEAPIGPEIQETTGEKAAARTYQDLLKTAYDEDLFEHYVGAQVVRVDVSGKVSPVGKADLITRAEPSPDGRYLLVEALHRPFSRLVQVGDFGRRVEIWDRDGKKVAELADREPAEQTPIGRDAVPVGPRKHDWRGDADATVYWLEALDGGAPLQPADKRDVVRTLTPLSRERPRTWSRSAIALTTSPGRLTASASSRRDGGARGASGCGCCRSTAAQSSCSTSQARIATATRDRW